MVRKIVAFMDYDSGDKTQQYIQTIARLGSERLITPSQSRGLSDSGKETIDDLFDSEIDVERVVRVVKHVRLGNALYNEQDAFIYEAADVIIRLTDDVCKERIKNYVTEKVIPTSAVYVLAAIHVMQQAADQGLLEINPNIDLPKGYNYVGHLDPK